MIGKFESGESYSSYDWKFVPTTESQDIYYVFEKDGRLGEEFTDPAIPAYPVKPEQINECPECGEWAGQSDEPIHCIFCGYSEK
jgi:hypothetical protein